MYTHHKLDHELEGEAEVAVAFIVCALPRSGSSLLCELLCDTALAGAPTEFFDPELMAKFRESWAVRTFDEYLQALISRKTSPNGVFGLKAHYWQLVNAFHDADVGEAFPNLHYVYIRREDRVRQAVSYARALQTGQWASEHTVLGSEYPVFKRDQIDRLLARIRDQEQMWESFFERNGAVPLRLVYEDLVESPEEAVLAVMDFLGVKPPQPFSLKPPTLKKQADLLSERWVQRYLSVAGNRLPGAGAEPVR